MVAVTRVKGRAIRRLAARDGHQVGAGHRPGVRLAGPLHWRACGGPFDKLFVLKNEEIFNMMNYPHD